LRANQVAAKLGEIFRPHDLLVIFSLAVAMTAFEYSGLLTGVEGWLEDRYLIFAGSGQPPVSSSVVVLDIDDDAYRDCFDGRSPMNASSLESLLRQIDQLGAAVIGVDILTDPHPGDPKDPNYLEAKQNQAVYRGMAKFKTKIVWIAGVDNGRFHAEVPNVFGWFIGEPDEMTIKPTDVLGFDPGELEDKKIAWGPAVYTAEGDRKLRRFPREVRISADPTSDMGVFQNSWARLIGDSFCTGRVPSCTSIDDRSEVFLPIGAEPVLLSVHYFFSCTPHSGPRKFSIQKGKEDLLKLQTSGRIVLLGGTFASSGDFHETPAGRDAGIVINARAVEAEISGSGLEEVKPYKSFGLDLATGLVMLLGFFVLEEIFRQNRVLVTISGSLAAVALLWVAVYVSIGKHYVFSFATLILGVLIHQLIDLWKKQAAPAHHTPEHHAPTHKPPRPRRRARR
jgi:CHASE2 domain-containing sensor protein